MVAPGISDNRPDHHALVRLRAASAADCDAGVFSGNRQRAGRAAPALTIFDEIDDRTERDAFRDAWNAKEPKAKRDLAEAFVRRYPAVDRACERRTSSLPAQVPTWETILRRSSAPGARCACCPKIRSLLVMMADIAAKQSDLDLAEQSARDALRYLTNADTPSAVHGNRMATRSVTSFVPPRISCWDE